VLTAGDGLGNGIGNGVVAAFTDATSLLTLRGLEAGSGAGSTGTLAAASKATYKTFGVRGSTFAGLSTFRTPAASTEEDESRPGPFSESSGRAAATEGTLSDRIQAMRTMAATDRFVEQ